MIVDYSNWAEFRELNQITVWKEGQIFNTKRLGFVKKDYTPTKDEVVSPLSTSMIGKEIKLLK